MLKKKLKVTSGTSYKEPDSCHRYGNILFFLKLAAVLICFAHVQNRVSHPGRCRHVSTSDEVRIICLYVNFTRLPSKAFPVNTTYLSVHFSNLSSITSDDLKTFSHLRDLNLIKTQLRRLPADLLKGLSNLHGLDLTGNKLTSLPSQVFYYSPLVDLTLSNNLLSEADADCVPLNSSIQRLDLSSNKFTQLPVAFLQRLSNLESLDFRNNQLEELASGVLNSLSKLESLDLVNNKLKSIDASAFHSNPNLRQLFLGGNRLQSLPDGLFLKQRELVFLDLSNNYLKNLSSGILEGRLSAVFSGNPWHCNPGLAHLWYWVCKNENRLFHGDRVICQTPEHLKGRNITTISATELGMKK
ncbi:phospholipase A2 inhibitor beta-like [Xyrauchen texanus]|uniref:phospholipase A2 inhibitor beta-like n=1 Tax=Xyrauchen texanus TaxID=154827 RepID=UPI0022427A95|nr:phospholipase A2 inhibitor beta-like [Xyrauchen texanus]